MLTKSLCHPAVADLCGWLLRGPEAEGPAQFRLHSSLPDQSRGVVVQQPNHTLATRDSSSVSTSSMLFWRSGPHHFTKLEAASASRASLTTLIAADMSQDSFLRALTCSGQPIGPKITQQRQLIL